MAKAKLANNQELHAFGLTALKAITEQGDYDETAARIYNSAVFGTTSFLCLIVLYYMGQTDSPASYKQKADKVITTLLREIDMER